MATLRRAPGAFREPGLLRGALPPGRRRRAGRRPPAPRRHPLSRHLPAGLQPGRDRRQRRALGGRRPLPRARGGQRRRGAGGFYLLASCYFELGQGKKAVAPLEQALARDPTFADAHFLLGIACLERGFSKKALAALRQSLRLEPLGLLPDELFAFLAPRPDEPALLAAAAALAEGDADAAARALRQAAGPARPAIRDGRWRWRSSPRRPAAGPRWRRSCAGRADQGGDEGALVAGYATLAETWRAEGRERDAAAAAEQLLLAAASPLGRCVARCELALTLAGEERLDRARELAAAALAEAPAAGRRFALEVQGWVLFLSGRAAPAVDCLSQSNDLGSNARTLTQLGMALLAAGRKEAARPVLVTTVRVPRRTFSIISRCCFWRLALRPDEQEIEDDHHQQHRDEDAAERIAQR